MKEELHLVWEETTPEVTQAQRLPVEKIIKIIIISSGSISGYKMTLISQGRCWRGVGDGSMLQ